MKYGFIVELFEKWRNSPPPPPPPASHSGDPIWRFGDLIWRFSTCESRQIQAPCWVGGVAWVALWWAFSQTQELVFWLFLRSYLTSGPFSCWYFLLLKQRFFWYYSSHQVMAILCCVAQKTASAAHPRIRSQNRNGSKGSVRDLWLTNFCKNPRKYASLPCPFNINVLRFASKIIFFLCNVFASLWKFFSYCGTRSFCFVNKFLVERVRLASTIIFLLSDVFVSLWKQFSFYQICSLRFENNFCYCRRCSFRFERIFLLSNVFALLWKQFYFYLLCSLRCENNFLTIECVRFASISKKTPLSKLSFAFVSISLPLLGCNQIRGSILSWSVIFSVYGADTIAIDLSLSALISWFMK